MSEEPPVRAFRRKHRLTQADLAEHLDVSLRTVENWDRRPDPTRVVALALAALEVELSKDRQ